MPEIGASLETVEHGEIKFTAFDVGGSCHPRITTIFKAAFEACNGVIWVVDSNDRDRIVEARETLVEFIHRPLSDQVPVLVLANKQDLPGVMPVAEIVKRLQLSDMRGRRWHVQSGSAFTREGLLEGLEWLKDAMAAQQLVGDEARNDGKEMTTI